MAATRHPVGVRLGRRAATRRAQPAAAAAGAVFGASVVIGLFGLASAAFVIARLFASWRVTSSSTSHHVSIFGQSLTYPTANVGAIVIVVLGALGLLAALAALHTVVRELAAARRFRRRLSRQRPRALSGAHVIDDPRPQAFCSGLLRPRVYVSTGTVALLGERELDAVLAHERHHARRRDPLRLATGRVLAQALFFIPPLAALVSHQQALAELGADEAAVTGAPSLRPALASAMLSFADAHADVDPDRRSGGIDPARVDYLVDERLTWRFPLAVALAALGLVAVLAAAAVLAGQAAAGSATLSPPFLSAQPCGLVFSILPAALGLTAVVIGREQARSALRGRTKRSRA